MFSCLSSNSFFMFLFISDTSLVMRHILIIVIILSMLTAVTISVTNVCSIVSRVFNMEFYFESPILLPKLQNQNT